MYIESIVCIVLNTEYSYTWLMIKITRLLSEWVGRSLWLYKFLVKVKCISLTFDLQCPLVLQHEYSLTGPEGIQPTFSRQSGQRNKRSSFILVEKSYTHGASLCYVLCYTCVHVCVKVAGRESERGQNVNALVFLFTVQPVCFSFL